MGEHKEENWIEWANAWNRARDHYNQIRNNIEKLKREFSKKLKKQIYLGA